MKATLAQKRQGRVDLMVSLSPNSLPLRADDVSAQVNAVKQAGDRVLASLPKNGYEIKRRWSAVAGMVLSISVALCAPEQLSVGRSRRESVEPLS